MDELEKLFSRRTLLILTNDEKTFRKEFLGDPLLNGRNFSVERERLILRISELFAYKYNELSGLLRIYKTKKPREARKLTVFIKSVIKLDSVKRSIQQINHQNKKTMQYDSILFNFFREETPTKTDEVSVQIVRMQRKIELPRHSKIAFSIETVPATHPLGVVDEDGNVREISGELLYVEQGSSSGIRTPRVITNHVYYNPETQEVYCFHPIARVYRIAEKSSVEFREYGGIVEIDLAAVSDQARTINEFLTEVKENYITWLTDGLLMMGFEVNIRGLIDDTALNEMLSNIHVVIHRDGTWCQGVYPNIKIADWDLATREGREYWKRTVLHEFGHVFLTTVSSLNSETEETDSWNGGILSEGSTEMLTLIISLANGEITHPGIVYGPHVNLSMILLHVLGPEKFFGYLLRSGEVNMPEEISDITGRSYAEMILYYLNGLIHGFNYVQQDAMIMLLTVRLLGEMEQYGVVDVQQLIDQHDESMHLIYGEHLKQFRNRYNQQEDSSFLEQSYNSSKLASWSGVLTVHEFDVRDLLETALGSDYAHIISRYHTHFIVLNSLDYESYNLEHQQIALALLHNIAEDFTQYWNSLSPEERMYPSNQCGRTFLTLAIYALGARYGLTLESAQYALQEGGGTDAEMTWDSSSFQNGNDPGETTNKTLRIESIEREIEGELGINDRITNGRVVLSLPGDWEYQRSFYIDDEYAFHVRMSASDEIAITFENGEVSVRGLESEAFEESILGMLDSASDAIRRYRPTRR